MRCILEEEKKKRVEKWIEVYITANFISIVFSHWRQNKIKNYKQRTELLYVS